MISTVPLATYRIQLRDGVGFEEVEARLDHLCEMGISHLYLSPIFAAVPGSTHGYDVIDPSQIDPAIGGRAGFERLADKAISRNLGIILDIVPNHTAFSLENPWLRDVLIHGRKSRYAGHFDIDWSAGRLVLPFLPEPFEKMLEEDRFSLEEGYWVFGDTRVPLAAGTEGGRAGREELRRLHGAQHWRLRHWEIERDGITHRRFFNITGLIGMRVEERAVFEDTHRLTIDLVRQGLVHGLRIDHVDGLADPRGYLEWLAAALPGTPVWVEKILSGRETLPDGWRTAGTTGYEAARMIARLLTDKAGYAELDTEWRRRTGATGDFEQVLAAAKHDVLVNELAAELHRLIAIAAEAVSGSALSEPGPESLREAIVAMLAAMPRYRTYVDAAGASDDDVRLIHDLVARARTGLRSDRVLNHLADLLLQPATPAARAFASRFQQVSGALLAKAQEDTAGFRWTRFAAANEVGAEPDDATVGEEEADRFLALRRTTDMTLTSSHDTKRSEDARMRLVAISHHPAAFSSLVEAAEKLPETGGVEPKWRWYVVQSALAIWDGGSDALKARLAQHLQKAMREAKETTFWTSPNEAAESSARAFAEALCNAWRTTPPAEIEAIVSRGQVLSLAQVALKCLMPGFPDFYRGTEAPFFALTDPDNRLPVDWSGIDDLPESAGFAGEKVRLTRRLLELRRQEQTFMASAAAGVSVSDGRLTMERRGVDRRLVLEFGPTPAQIPPALVWRTEMAGKGISIFWS